MNEVTLQGERIVVLDESGKARYSIPGCEEARNQYGYETGRTWLEEFEADNLVVGQFEDGYCYGSVWANY